MTDTPARPSAPRVLATYERLLACSSRMLALAREHDWEALIREETDYLRVASCLVELERSVVLGPGQQNRKAELLARILEQDGELRRRLVARRDELSTLIGVSRRRRDLNRSYGRADALQSHDYLDKGRS